MNDNNLEGVNKMSNKLNIDNKEDIPNIINAIAKIHGVNSAKLVLDGLVENYNPELLIDILRRKIKEKNEKANSSFIIGLEVYLEMYIYEIKQTSAIKRISDKYGIKENTVKTHIDNFRKFIKEETAKSPNYRGKTEMVKECIDDLIKVLYGLYYWAEYEYDMPEYHEPNRKEETYKEKLQKILKPNQIDIPF